MHITQFFHIGFGLLYHTVYCPKTGDIEKFKVFSLNFNEVFEEVILNKDSSSICKLLYEEAIIYMQKIIKEKIINDKGI
jgi:hypothetical protein